MTAETPKQKLRRLLDRLSLDPAKKRQFDALIEEASDEDADLAVTALDEMEAEAPGTLERLIEEINTNGIPDDDD